jgi:hypothetical protein
MIEDLAESFCGLFKREGTGRSVGLWREGMLWNHFLIF